MSRYPTAQWRPIRDTSRAALRKDLLGLHTMVGGMRGTWSYFDRLDVQPYSHFLIGGIWGSDADHGLDGDIWQIADTDYRAAANLDGNYRVISVETADNAARPIRPWTERQQAAIVRIMVEAHRLDGIPLVLVPDSKPGRRGICYHRQGCDPYRVAGGERWSTAYGKDCPTDPRIRQIPGLIDRARRIVDGGTDQQEDTLSAADVTAINRHTDQATAELYRQLARGEFAGKLSPAHLPNSFAGIRTLLAAQANTAAGALAAVRLAIADVQADVDVQGDDEAKILAELGAAEDRLAELIEDTHEPAPGP